MNWTQPPPRRRVRGSRHQAGAAGCLAIVLVLVLAGPGRAQPAIVGGTPAPAGAWPSIAALLHTAVADPFQAQFCGGTLIDAAWVLTAAHCVEGESPASVKVAVGALRLSAITAGQRTGVVRVIIHPDWNTTSFANDVALLQLATPSAHQRMDLLSPLDDSAMVGGQDASVAGWGCALEPVFDPVQNDVVCPPGGFPDALLQAPVDILDNAQCSGSSSAGARFVPAIMVCAGNFDAGRPDTCFGDSGGPLTIAGSSGAAVLVGDTSFGEAGCVLPGRPTAYGRLSAFRSWVYQQLGLSPPAAPAAQATKGPGQGQATVTWQAPTDGGRPIAGYRVTAQPGDRTVTIPASTTSTTIAALDPAVAHTFGVAAVSAVGIGPEGTSSEVFPDVIAPQLLLSRPARLSFTALAARRAVGTATCSKNCQASLQASVSDTVARQLQVTNPIATAVADLRAGVVAPISLTLTPAAATALRSRTTSFSVSLTGTATDGRGNTSAPATTTLTAFPLSVSASLGSPRRGSVRTALRRGLRTRVRCATACRASVTLTVDRRTAIRYRLGRRQITVARTTAMLSADRSRLVRLRFTRRARARLASVRVFSARLRFTATAPGYRTSTKLKRVRVGTGR
jgi:secreted trypsin-like serine protease